MWRPGFRYEAAFTATIVGFERSFCIYSTHHRGSHERPGLVLGLDRGGASNGILFRVSKADRAETVAYLRAREQVNGVYRECWVTATPHEHPVGTAGQNMIDPGGAGGWNVVAPAGAGGKSIIAMTYVAERGHPSYAGRLPLQEQARLIRAARGLSGVNVDYLVNTSRHLTELGLRDRNLERLVTEIGGFFAHRLPDPAGAARTAALVAACRPERPSAPRMRPGERRRFHHRMKLDAN